MAAIATAVDFPVSRIESEVVRLRALMEKGQFAAALSGATGLLEEVPENRDVCYIIAVSQRYLRYIEERAKGGVGLMGFNLGPLGLMQMPLGPGPGNAAGMFAGTTPE